MTSSSTTFFKKILQQAMWEWLWCILVSLPEFLHNYKCDKNSNSYCTCIRGAEIATQLLILRISLFDLGFLSCINNKLCFWVLLFVHWAKRLLYHSAVSKWKEVVSSCTCCKHMRVIFTDEEYNVTPFPWL